MENQTEKAVLPVSDIIQAFSLDQPPTGRQVPSETFINHQGFLIPEPSDNLLRQIASEQERIAIRGPFEPFSIPYFQNGLTEQSSGAHEIASPLQLAEAWLLQTRIPQLFENPNTGEYFNFEQKVNATFIDYIKDELEPGDRLKILEALREDYFKNNRNSFSGDNYGELIQLATTGKDESKVDYHYLNGVVYSSSNANQFLPVMYHDAKREATDSYEPSKYVPYQTFINDILEYEKQPGATVILQNENYVKELFVLDREIEIAKESNKFQEKEFNIIELNPNINQIRLIGKDEENKPVIRALENKEDIERSLDNKKVAGLSFNVNKHSSFFSNFIGNFTRNFKAGQNSRFLILPVEKTTHFLNQLFDQSRYILANRKNINQAPIKTYSEMETPTKTNSRFNFDQVDWNGIQQTTGITADSLKQSGDLERFLNGQKTSLLNLSGELTSKSGIKIRMHQPAKIKLVDDGTGKLNLVIHGVRPQPDIRNEYLGYKLNEVDKYNLKNFGEMGKVVECIDIQTRQPFAAVIGIDPETKEMVSMRADRLPKMIPDNLKGVNLTEDQKKSLAEGKPTLIADMIDRKGEKFTSHVVISAGKQGLDFRFKNNVPVLSIPETAIKQNVTEQHKVQEAQNEQGNKTEKTKKQEVEAGKPTEKVKTGKQAGQKETESKKRGKKV